MSQRILIVDDDQDNLSLIARTLQRHDFETSQARSGPEALELLNRELPDLVLLDVMMPQMDGYEVCRRIRANPRTARLPVVLLTAYAKLASRVEAFRAGADDYITKPIRTAELIGRLRAALEHSASESQKRGRVVSVLGVRGGVGATTLAINLALALTAQARTILADLETDGMAAVHLGLEPKLGLGSLLTREVDDIDLTGVEAALTLHLSGLRLLAAASIPADPVRVGVILNHLLTICDVCVLDLGASLGQIARAVARRSDDLILAFESDRVALKQTEQVMRGLHEAGLPRDALKLVWINRADAPVDIGRAAIQAALGRDPTIIIEPAALALYHALERAQPLVLSQPEHPVSVQIRALAELVMKAAG